MMRGGPAGPPFLLRTAGAARALIRCRTSKDDARHPRRSQIRVLRVTAGSGRTARVSAIVNPMPPAIHPCLARADPARSGGGPIPTSFHQRSNHRASTRAGNHHAPSLGGHGRRPASNGGRMSARDIAIAGAARMPCRPSTRSTRPQAECASAVVHQLAPPSSPRRPSAPKGASDPGRHGRSVTGLGIVFFARPGATKIIVASMT